MSSLVARPAADAAGCPACGGAMRPFRAGRSDLASAPRYRIARTEYGTPHPLERCAGCGLGRARPGWGRPEVLGAYAEHEEPEYGAEEPARRRGFRRGLERVRRVVPGGRLLDVGAATGLLLVEARALGFEVAGLEPSRWAAAEARRRHALHVVEGTLEEAPLPPRSFDVLTLVDVVEHFVDPFAALAAAARLLRPGGALYLVTPDPGSLAARLLGPRWWGYEPFHLWYFTRASLEHALSRAGFVPRSFATYPRSFSAAYWLRKGEGLQRALARAAGGAARALGVAERTLTLDLRDTHEVIALRTAS